MNDNMPKEPSIVFVTHISYLDGAIEHIKRASQINADYHVVITLTPKQVFKNIIDIRHVNLEEYESIVNFEDIRVAWKLELFDPYFEKCKSVRFVVYKEHHALTALFTSIKLNRLIKKLKPKFIHFDSFMNRQIFQIPFFFRFRNSIILNVHDAKLHSGEDDKIRIFIQKFLYKWCFRFVTFSNFSKNQLSEQLHPKKQIIDSFLLPFDFYRNYLDKEIPLTNLPKKISFVGRISKYKGIDLFIDSINIILKTLPTTEFIIAGKPYGGYRPDFDKIENPAQLLAIQKHLSNYELVSVIMQSQLIVCPYIDASQSGVVMTSLALNRPVLVTEAGGLKEYVEEGVNGLICQIDEKDLALKVVNYSDSERFEELRKKMASTLHYENLDRRYVTVLKEKIYA